MCPGMTESLETVHEFGAGEMPDGENEGFVPVTEGIIIVHSVS